MEALNNCAEVPEADAPSPHDAEVRKQGLVARPARTTDLAGIMEVEKASFGEEIGQEGMATAESMLSRIRLCNKAWPGWFWVLCNENEEVKGYFVLQPTSLPAASCRSWAQATDDGNLVATFDSEGAFLYGVSLGIAHDAPRATIHGIAHTVHRLRLQTGKQILYACARMPGFRGANKVTNISAGSYWQQRRHGLPLDPFLRLFEGVLGLRPERLLPNGYPPDMHSGGHGVLCMSKTPLEDLRRVQSRLNHLDVDLRTVEWQPNEENLVTPGPMVVESLPLHEEKLSALRLGERTWYDVASKQWVDAATLGLAQGCPDWGERGGQRNGLCAFCALPSAARMFRDAYYAGRPMTSDEHFGLFAENLARLGTPHTLGVFNAGSFLAAEANPVELQFRIVRLVAQHPTIQRLVIESRAELVTQEAIDPLVAILAAAGKSLTIRVGVETQDDDLRLKRLRKGHTRAQMIAAVDVIHRARVLPGAYCLLNPAPHLDHQWAVDEAEATLHWCLEECGFAEAYFCATCVAPGTPLARSWQSGEFRPATLWEVWEVLRRTVPKYGLRIHLLPFTDEPPLIGIPSNHVETGVGEDLQGARGCDLEWHRFLADYRRGAVSEEALLSSAPACSCRPDWIP